MFHESAGSVQLITSLYFCAAIFVVTRSPTHAPSGTNPLRHVNFFSDFLTINNSEDIVSLKKSVLKMVLQISVEELFRVFFFQKSKVKKKTEKKERKKELAQAEARGLGRGPGGL